MDFFLLNPLFNFQTTFNSKHIVNCITFFKVYASASVSASDLFSLFYSGFYKKYILSISGHNLKDAERIRKKLILEELLNSSETEDMRKIP